MTNLKKLHTLTQFRRGETKYGLATHKPILVLSILDLLEKRDIPQIIVNHKRFEENESSYKLNQLHGKILLPPSNENYAPSLEKLREHRLYWRIANN